MLTNFFFLSGGWWGLFELTRWAQKILEFFSLSLNTVFVYSSYAWSSTSRWSFFESRRIRYWASEKKKRTFPTRQLPLNPQGGDAKTSWIHFYFLAWRKNLIKKNDGTIFRIIQKIDIDDVINYQEMWLHIKLFLCFVSISFCTWVYFNE